MTCCIYALVDPQTDEIFYVGSSTLPDNRLDGHIHGDTNRANQERIEQIMANGHELKMRILEEVPEEMRLEQERKWINRLIEKGVSLTNSRLIDREETQQSKITVKVDDEFHRQIRILSVTTAKPISEKVRECLEEWLREADQEEDEDGSVLPEL